MTVALTVLADAATCPALHADVVWRVSCATAIRLLCALCPALSSADGADVPVLCLLRLHVTATGQADAQDDA